MGISKIFHVIDHPVVLPNTRGNARYHDRFPGVLIGLGHIYTSVTGHGLHQGERHVVSLSRLALSHLENKAGHVTWHLYL